MAIKWPFNNRQLLNFEHSHANEDRTRIEQIEEIVVNFFLSVWLRPTNAAFLYIDLKLENNENDLLIYAVKSMRLIRSIQTAMAAYTAARTAARTGVDRWPIGLTSMMVFETFFRIAPPHVADRLCVRPSSVCRSNQLKSH